MSDRAADLTINKMYDRVDLASPVIYYVASIFCVMSASNIPFLLTFTIKSKFWQPYLDSCFTLLNQLLALIRSGVPSYDHWMLTEVSLVRVIPRKVQPQKWPKCDGFRQVVIPLSARRHRSQAYKSPRWHSGRYTKRFSSNGLHEVTHDRNI